MIFNTASSETAALSLEDEEFAAASLMAFNVAPSVEEISSSLKKKEYGSFSVCRIHGRIGIEGSRLDFIKKAEEQQMSSNASSVGLDRRKRWTNVRTFLSTWSLRRTDNCSMLMLAGTFMGGPIDSPSGVKNRASSVLPSSTSIYMLQDVHNYNYDTASARRIRGGDAGTAVMPGKYDPGAW